ncbi:MAG: class I SAM-dependent methyltransferase [Planctomycetes bacterium]|nr:class I SAM-dependent methyltransferase [Planctomycetota bacterium]
MTATDGKTLVARAKTLGAELDDVRATQLLAYLDAMLALNEQINLTAVRDREAAVVLHALDGLAFARTGLHPRHVLDIGTGNGFPGVAVATLHPGASVVLMDRTGKKVRAIGACLVQAKYDRVETLNLDAAQAPGLRKDLRHAFDVVTARAVGKPEAMAELADPLLRPGGHLVLWLDADAVAAERLGPFRRTAILPYDLPDPAARKRVLGAWQKR